MTKYAAQLAQSDRSRAARRPGVKYGFLLHDIGKIAIPDTVLNKPGPLTTRSAA